MPKGQQEVYISFQIYNATGSAYAVHHPNAVNHQFDIEMNISHLAIF